MDLDDTPEQAAYRAQVRSWLDAHKGEAPVLQGPGALEDEDETTARACAARSLVYGRCTGR